MIVTETSVGGDTQQIAAEPHRLVADDHGRKRWPLERIRVTLRHSRIHAKDCADCETSTAWIDHIDCDVELIGDLDDTHRHGYCTSPSVALSIRP